MRKCPNCQFINLDNREDCLKCGAILTHREGLEPDRLNRRRRPVPPSVDTLRRLGGRIGRSITRGLAVPLPENISHRFPWVAGFLGLIPGLGQLYNHQTKKVFYLAPPFIMFLVLAMRLIREPWWGNLMIVGVIAIVLLSFSDAFATAARVNGQTFNYRNRLALMTYPVFLFGAFWMLCDLMSVLQWPVYTHFHIRARYMAPFFEHGDGVIGEAVTYWFRRPAPGDIVRYDPPPFSVWQGDQLYSVDAQNGWERVMAVGGETLESREGIFYVNGRRLSHEYYPLMPENLPLNFSIECPGNLYLVVISARAEDKGLVNRLRSAAGQVPFLDGEDWKKACLVESKDIFDRSWFIYKPAPRRRFLRLMGSRFVEESRDE